MFCGCWLLRVALLKCKLVKLNRNSKKFQTLPSKMPASRKVSPRQLEILLDFLEANRDLASGRCARGPLASQITDRSWETVAAKLNSVADGVTKSASQWRRYWVEWKAKTKAKAADIRRNVARTGGGPNRLMPLNDTEQRVIGLISQIAVQGHQEALLPNPFSSTPSQPGPSIQIDQSPKPTQSFQAGRSSQIAHSPEPRSIIPFVKSQSPLPDFTEEEWLEDIDSEMIPSTSTPPPRSPQQPTIDQASLSPPNLSMPPPATSSTQYPAAAEIQQPQQIPRLRSRTLRDIPQWVRDIEERNLAIAERRLVTQDRTVEILQSLDSRLANIESGMAKIIEVLENLIERFQK